MCTTKSHVGGGDFSCLLMAPILWLTSCNEMASWKSPCQMVVSAVDTCQRCAAYACLKIRILRISPDIIYVLCRIATAPPLINIVQLWNYNFDKVCIFSWKKSFVCWTVSCVRHSSQHDWLICSTWWCIEIEKSQQGSAHDTIDFFVQLNTAFPIQHSSVLIS